MEAWHIRPFVVERILSSLRPFNPGCLWIQDCREGKGKKEQIRLNIELFPSILSLSSLPARFLPVGEIPGLLGRRRATWSVNMIIA